MNFECLIWFAGGIIIGIMIMLIIIIHLRNKLMKELEKAMKEMNVKTIEKLLKGEGEKNEEEK